MKKSLSLVVALAMVFSLLVPAMAFAATAAEQAAGAKLKELGVLKGNEQGDLMLDKELTRQEMIVLLSRLFGEEDQAKNHPNTHGWPDVANPDFDGYISWGKEKGLTKGVNDGSIFGYDQALTVQQLLQFLLRALGYDEVAYEDVPAKAVELGLVAEGTDMTAVASRGTMAVVTLVTLDTNVNGEGVPLGYKLGLPGYEVTAVAIASFKAVGAKKLEVVFNKAVDDSKASITVKKGANTVSVGKTTWNDAKTAVVLELNSKLTQGEYSVTVSGLSDQALTATTAVENERVASIEITAQDTIALPRSNANILKIPYSVKNQYGEEINNTSVQAYSSADSAPNATNGTLTVTAASNFKVNDSVYVAVYHLESAVRAEKTIKIGESSRASDIKIVELYHKDGSTLSVGSNDLNEYKLIIEVKDQYGNVMTDAYELNQDISAAIIGLSNLKLSEIKKGKIGDNDKIYLELAKDNTSEPIRAGSNTVNIVSKVAAASAQYTVVVAEGTVYDQVNLFTPAEQYAVGEVVKIPVNVIDKNGNFITNETELNTALSNSKIRVTVPGTSKPQFKKDGDNLYLQFTAQQQGLNYVYVISETGKPSNVSLNILAEAKPTVITGIASGQNTLVFYGTTLSLDYGSLVVEDQHGRVISKDSLEKMIKDKNYKIKVSDDGDAVVATDNWLDSTPIALKGNQKGTKTLKFEIYDPSNKLVTGSEFSAEFRTVVISEVQSIEVADIGTFYNYSGTSTAYARELKVSGITSDGKKVTIPTTEYNVYEPAGVTKSAKSDLSAYELRAQTFTFNQDEDTKTFTVRVVINALGKEATVQGIASKVAPKVASAVFKNGNDTITELEVNAGVTVNYATFTLELKDQYGVKATKSGSDYKYGDGSTVSKPAVTISDIVLKDSNAAYPTIQNNGGSNASIKADNVKSFTVTLNYGGVTASIKVNVKN